MQPDRSNESTLRFACAGDDQGNESCSYIVQYVTVTVSVTVCVVSYHLEMTKAKSDGQTDRCKGTQPTEVGSKCSSWTRKSSRKSIPRNQEEIIF